MTCSAAFLPEMCPDSSFRPQPGRCRVDNLFVKLKPSLQTIDLPSLDLVEGRQLAKSLGMLLDKAPGSREVLPHLAALERGLLEFGIVAIDRVPERWLARICSQLSILPFPEQDPSLHELLRVLMTRVKAQTAEESDWIKALDSKFDPEKTVVIREISHTEFDAASDENRTTVRMPKP